MSWSLTGDLEVAWWQPDVDPVQQSGAPSKQQSGVRMQLLYLSNASLDKRSFLVYSSRCGLRLRLRSENDINLLQVA